MLVRETQPNIGLTNPCCNRIITVVPGSLFCTEPCRNGSLLFQTCTEVMWIKRYFGSVALVPQGLAALHVEEVGLLGGAGSVFWNLPSAKPEVCGAPEHGEVISEGQTVLIPLLSAASSSARQPHVPAGGSDPGLDGKLPDGSLQGVEGKID